MWARALTKVAAPYRVKFAHQIYLGFGKLALPLRDGGEAIKRLSAKDTRGAGALASTARDAMTVRVRYTRLAQRLGRNVGDQTHPSFSRI